MTVAFRLVKVVDGSDAKDVAFSKDEIGLILSALYYARVKDYYEPRKKSYRSVHNKISLVAVGVVKCFG
jgi:hypothetical protein